MNLKIFRTNLYLVFLIALNTSCTYSSLDFFVDNDGLSHDILVLASDSMLGRAPLSVGEERTVKYIEDRMSQIGLKPIFNGSYFQEVPMIKLNSIVPNAVKIQTPTERLELKSYDDYSAWCPVLDEKINIKKAELVFVGFGIYAPEIEWNSFKGLDVKGKILVVLVNDPDFYSEDSSHFKGRTMTYYGRWRYKFEEAERQGALGCLIIHEDEAAGYPWPIVSIKTNSPDFYLDESSLATKRCKLNGWITKDAAIKLFKYAGLDYFTEREKASKIDYQPISLKSTLDIDVKNSWSRANSKNIAGYIKGTDSPEEFITYTAHWDHLGIGVPVNGDSIYNGASDNAAAIAWMFAISRQFMLNPPKRSVVFLSPTAEESGLIGSEYFVKNCPYSIQNTIACINYDVILFLGKFRDVTVTGLGHSELDELLNQSASQFNRYIIADPNPENGMFFRSDQLPFLKSGIPSVFAKGYSDQIELGKEMTQKKINYYWQNIYHKPADEFTPSKDNIEGLVDDVRLFYYFGSMLANTSIKPKWYKNSEFYTER